MLYSLTFFLGSSSSLLRNIPWVLWKPWRWCNLHLKLFALFFHHGNMLSKFQLSISIFATFSPICFVLGASFFENGLNWTSFAAAPFIILYLAKVVNAIFNIPYLKPPKISILWKFWSLPHFFFNYELKKYPVNVKLRNKQKKERKVGRSLKLMSMWPIGKCCSFTEEPIEQAL